MEVDVGAVTVQPIAPGTTTAPVLLIVNKVLGRKPLRIDPVIMPLVVSESNLIAPIVRKCRITIVEGLWQRG
jgi:hypothetical protein